MKDESKCTINHCQEVHVVIHKPSGQNFCWKHWEEFCKEKDEDIILNCNILGRKRGMQR